MILLREMTTVRSVNNSIVFQNISTIAGRHHCNLRYQLYIGVACLEILISPLINHVTSCLYTLKAVCV